MPSPIAQSFFTGSMAPASGSKPLKLNQISKIQDLMPPERWKHVDGLQNPADVGSRGILANELKQHKLWWSGPDWIGSKFTAPPSLEALQSLGVTNDN